MRRARRPAEVVTEFFPLDADPAPPFESAGQMLRVPLPATPRCARVGLPVRDDHVGGSHSGLMFWWGEEGCLEPSEFCKAFDVQ